MNEKTVTFFENKTKVLLALLLPAVILYAKSLKFGFTTMDEQWMIVKDAWFLEKWENLKNVFLHPSTGVYYRPLFMVSLILDYHIAKLSPWIYHLTNLLWHLASVLLVFQFLTRLNVQKKAAFYLCLFFSVHPVLLQAVTWVPGRNDIMLLAFTLAALIQLKNYLEHPVKKYLFLNIFFFACALFTKESAIVLPLVFVVFFLIFRSSQQKGMLFLVSTWLFVAVSWFLLRDAITPGLISGSNSLSTNIRNSVSGYLLFIGKVIFPIQQSVLPTIKQASLLPGIFTLAVLVLLCFKPGVKDKRTAFFGLFLFFLLLLIPVWFGACKAGSEHYEQRIYGPLAGILLFFSQVKFNLKSRVFAYALYTLFAFYLVKSFVRMNIYRNEMSFLDAGIKERPDYYLFPLQKADLLSDKHDYPAALKCYDQSLALRPNFAHAVSNRGSAYYSMRRFNEAIVDYTYVIKNSEFNELYYLNRCHAYLYSKDPESAMRDLIVLKKCCQKSIEPDFEKEVLTAWIANMEVLKARLAKEQTNAGLCYKIAILYFDIEMDAEGLDYLKLAALLDPGNKDYQELIEKQKKQKS